MQLNELGFKKNEDYFVYEENLPMGCCASKSDKREMRIYFAIRFKSNYVDDIAHRKKIKARMKDQGIMMPFNKRLADDFVAFDSRLRLECIQEYLTKEINFEHYLNIGVVEDHYPLHKVEGYENLEKSSLKYLRKLSIGLLEGSKKWFKYLEPIQIIKRYYGEKFAFFYLYFIHF